MSIPQDAIWVKTAPSPDGKTYMVTLEASEDQALCLTTTSAAAYVHVLLGAVARAEYDAAVVAQMTALVPGPHAVSLVIRELRENRPPLDDSRTAPLRFTPGVSQGHDPFIRVDIEGRANSFQWTPGEARQHALHVLDAVQAADLDSHYYRVLRSMVNLDEPRARAVVDAVGGFRPA